MARKTRVELIDDLSGGSADRTVTFGRDGKLYEIDLSTKNAAMLTKTLSAYVASGRKLTLGGTSGRGSYRPNPENAKIRAWQVEHGYELGNRGRIPADIQEAYRHHVD